MRKAITGSILGLGALVICCMGGCTVKDAATDADGGAGAAGEGGAGGGTAGTGGGTAGTGGSASPSCGDVPVTGKCKDASTVTVCLLTDDGKEAKAVIKDTACGANRKCVEDAKGASCQNVGKCAPGDSTCAVGYGSVLTCGGTGAAADWAATACDTAKGEKCYISKPGQPAKCAIVPGSEGGKDDILKGRIQYEYKKVKDDKSGFESTLGVRDGTDLYVGIFNEKDELIGKALTGYNPDTQTFTGDGTWLAHLSEPATDKTKVWVWPMAFNYDTGVPMMALVHVKGDSSSTDTFDAAANGTDYWAFGPAPVKTDANFDMGTYLIKEADGSGAINAYEWVDYSLLRTGNSPSLTGKKQDSVLVMWEPGVKMDCGACYCPPGCGGAKVKYNGNDTDVDTYDTWLALSGTDASPKEWTPSTISHEMGHWAMQNYSLSPSEGGSHTLGEKINAAFAYSEGWATGFGQAGIEDPVYATVSNGTMWWINLGEWKITGNDDMAFADPSGPIDQDMDETVVAAMLFKLFAAPAIDPEGRGLGDDKVFAAFADPALVAGKYNRGYKKIDLVDFFDALVCTNNGTDADVSAISEKAGYPYKAADRTCH